ncbi:MAG: BrnA antitoxin family protein [Cyanobacteria bacterium P01_A01_bin.123]
MTPEQFANAVIRRCHTTTGKAQVTLQIDSDVLAWFQSKGQGYQTQINTLLREYRESRQ